MLRDVRRAVKLMIWKKFMFEVGEAARNFAPALLCFAG
jgi:hypothetical protein